MGLHAQGGDADDQSDHDRGQDGQHGGDPETEAGPRGQNGTGIRADAEERDLGEVDLSGHAHHEAEADSQQGEDDRHIDHVDRVAVEPVGEKPGGYHEQGDDKSFHARFTVFSPKMPVGRTITATANTRKTMSSEYP